MHDDKNKGLSLIVKTVIRAVMGIILIYGIYILSHGHLSPGGGFVGGVIIALAFISLLIGYGKVVVLKKLPRGVTGFLENLGVILFLSVALLGFTGGYFFLNFIGKGQPFKLFSGGTIPLYNLLISIKVGAGLFAIFVALMFLKVEGEDQL